MSPVVNKLKRPPVKFADAANPEAWRAVGRRLMTSAEFLWTPLNEAIEGFVATQSDRSREQAAKYGALADHFGAFFVLGGFASRNYLKAHLLANRIASAGPFRDGKEAIDFVMDRQTPTKARRRSHDLVALARAANVLTPMNEPLLERLTAHVLWAGRYPVPLDASDALFERTTRDRDLREIKALVEGLKR
jgi:hypothetical protein